MKTKKLFLGILFGLVLALGLMPGMSLTAYATEEWKNWTDANLPNGKYTITVGEKKLGYTDGHNTGTLYYDGSNITIWQLTQKSNIAGDATGTYYMIGKVSNPYERLDAQGWIPSTGDQGIEVANWDDGNVTDIGASCVFRISEDGYIYIRYLKPDRGVNTEVCYAVYYSNNRLVLRQYNGEEGLAILNFTRKVDVENISLNKESATLTVGGTETLTATLTPDNATDKKVKWSVGGTNAGAVKLYSDENCTTEVGADTTETLTIYAKGISAGSATVTATSNDDNTKTATCAVTVNKADSSVDTAPTAKTLTYNGNEQELVNAGTVTGGTFQYALGTDATTAPTEGWKEDIPTATDAGTYYVWYKVLGDSDHNPSPVYGPLPVVIGPASASELTDDEKPQPNALTYIDGVEQELVTAPKKLPEGYTKVQYSLDGGKTWTDEIPTGMESGDYTVSVQYIGDDNHTTKRGEDIKVTIGRAMEMQVDFIILRYNGTRGLPEEIDKLTISPVIHVKNGDDESVSKGLELDLTKGMESKVSKENVEFTGKVTDPAPGKYEVTVTGLPKSIFGRDKIYWTEGPVEGPVKWKYDLIAKGEINEKDKKIVVTVYLIFDDGSRPDEIKVVALPEDEIGAYQLRDDGTKEYLLFHTYGICMQWLGQDELCRGYERCFHKESPFVNPFVKP